MFVQRFFQRPQPRTFGFTPFYYDPEKDKERQPADQPRIKFCRVRKRILATKKSVRVKTLVVLIILVFLYFFWGLMEEAQKNFKIESIRVEETPSN